MSISRRQVLGAVSVSGIAAATGAARWWPAAAAPTLPAPEESGIEHVVLVMMENRSFDHYLGWLEGADGVQAGLRYRDRKGVRHRTHHLKTYDGCGSEDPDHSYEGGRVQYNHGKLDGFLRSGRSDRMAIGYYTEDDLSFYGPATRDWTVFDRYFSAVMAETYPNRFYQHAAQTDRLHNDTTQSHLTTIWDRLADEGLTGTYYFSDIPFTALWYDKHLDISRPFAQFLVDAAAGTLPQVSFVDPRFLDSESGLSNDDHPFADIRAGQMFLNQVYDAVRTGPGWEKTVLVINYDEWGGFFDHVRPRRAPDVSKKTALRGFRTPAMIISPLARRGHVSHRVYDHTSVLKMIEWRWGLRALTPRDRHANNMAEALDFAHGPDLTAPAYDVPVIVPAGCLPDEEKSADWANLKRLALDLGMRLPS